MTGLDNRAPEAGQAPIAADASRSAPLPGFLDHARSRAVVTTALRVALVVGTVLTLINQGDALFGEGDVSILKAALTYLVPYLVSTHGAVTARMGLLDASRT